MTAGLIPSKIQALSMEASVRQMPHSGSPPIPGSTGGKTDTLQSQHDKRIRIRLSLYVWLPLLNLTGRQWEWLLEDRWGEKNGFKNKTPPLPRSKYYPKRTTLILICFTRCRFSDLPPLDWALTHIQVSVLKVPESSSPPLANPEERQEQHLLGRGWRIHCFPQKGSANHTAHVLAIKCSKAGPQWDHLKEPKATSHFWIVFKCISHKELGSMDHTVLSRVTFNQA